MNFNSKQFALFFPVVAFLYYLLPHRFRWFMLLIASCVFYMVFIPKYILILAFTIIVDYFAGIFIEKSNGRKRKLFLVASIVANLGVLAFFKYFNFFVENINTLASFIHWNYSIEVLTIILPIGLSFHTFQAMSYTIEVYRGKQKAEKHIGIYALYVMFFPQLVAGPIERPQNLIHQFHERHAFNYERVTKGLKLMLWGFFKKIVIADNLAIVVNQVFNNSSSYSGPVLIMTVIFFTYQLYCDFSGYSDIALGSAQVLGFTLMTNFSSPFFSRSVTEFWRRWHISLSSWLRDYLYYPLVLSTGKITKTKMNLSILATFALIGLWHGAAWTFVIFGTLHGMYLVTESITDKYRKSFTTLIGLTKLPVLHHILDSLFTFVLVALSFVFFRAKSLAEVWYILTHLLTDISSIFTFSFWKILPSLVHVGMYELIFIVLSVLLLGLVEFWLKEDKFEDKISLLKAWIRFPIYYLLVASLWLFFVDGGQQFIYFQF